MQEGQSKRIELKEQNPHLAARMLEHLYSFDYSGQKTSIEDEEESCHISELHTHAQMYALGDEYDIQDLKDEASWRFENVMMSKKGQSDELTSVIEVINTVYTTTPESDRGLRDAIVTFGVNHLERMKELPEFKSAVILTPIYMIEVLPGFCNRVQDGGHYRKTCTKCGGSQWDFVRVECHSCKRFENLSIFERVLAS